MKGIMFTEAMFHATVEGRKTMTRRIMNPQPIKDVFAQEGFYELERNNQFLEYKPRYQLGKTVYIKEPYKIELRGGKHKVFFDYSKVIIDLPQSVSCEGILKVQNLMRKSKTGYCNKLFVVKGLPEYFPYKIEITAVRCERLQDISDEDCLKEGIFLDYPESHYYHYYDSDNRFYCKDCEEKGRERLIDEILKEKLHNTHFSELDYEDAIDELNGYSMDDFFEEAIVCNICGKFLSAYKNGADNEDYYEAQEAYAALIDSINGKGTWDSNPWVWVYDYKLLNNK